MRIAVYSGQIPGTTFIERLVLGLAQRDNTILLFGNKKGNISYPPNVKAYPVPEGSLGITWYVIRYLAALAFNYPADLLKVAALVRNYKGKKFRFLLRILPVMLHRPEVFHIQWAKSVNDWAWLKDFGIKLVVSLRGAHITYSPVVDEKLADIYKQQFPFVHAFHAVSNDIKEKASKLGAHNIQTIYSGLPLKNLEFLNGHKVTNERFEIVSIGRWHWVKGFSYAIDAIDILLKKGYKLHYTIIAGKGTEEALFHINHLNLEQYISVIPELSHEKVINHIKKADLVLVPSIVEGIANVALEAMAVGTTVLSTECGGIAEVIKDGYNGFLVPVRDSRAIADRVAAIAAMPKEEIHIIRNNARRTIEEQHHVEKMLDEFMNLYQSVL
jgi:glycosyltransferase involved in cell wall biosynthesis